MLRHALALVFVTTLTGATALAHDNERTPPPPAAAPAAEASAETAPLSLWVERQEKRPIVLSTLYGSYGTLQVMDIMSTRKSLTAGAREANPAMGSGGTTRMIVIKSAASAFSIYIAEKTWKKNRAGAIVMMAIVNGISAAVVAHNTRVTRAAAR